MAKNDIIEMNDQQLIKWFVRMANILTKTHNESDLDLYNNIAEEMVKRKIMSKESADKILEGITH